MNVLSYIILALIGAGVVFAIIRIRRKPTCGGDCSRCNSSCKRGKQR